MRNGSVCELYVTGSPYQEVKYGCYKESKIGSFAVARMVDSHRKAGTWKNKVNRFIALTEFARNKFIEAGFPEHKVVVKPNFVAEDLSDIQTTHEKIIPVKNTASNALFVGRLSQEKGMGTLLEAWKDLNIELKIAGTGPLEQSVRNNPNDNINYLEGLDRQSVLAEMRSATFLVMPSEWYEGFSMVLVEAFSQGLPVIASRLGGMAEIVEDRVTGLHFEAGNAADLAQKVLWLSKHPDECFEMGKNARNVYEQKYTAETNYQLLMDIYQKAIDSNSASSASN
jgi:glycosyltransferase involved in cell wall biosynthesis